MPLSGTRERVHAILGEDLESMRADMPLLDVRGVCAYWGGRAGDRVLHWVEGRTASTQRGDAHLRAWSPSV